MLEFTFALSTRIIFGNQKSSDLPKIVREFCGVSAAKILLVTDQGVLRAGMLEPLERSLKEARIPFSVFSDTTFSPNTELVNNAVRAAGAEQLSAIVGVGGGTCLDLTKALAIGLANGEFDAEAYEGYDKYPAKELVPIFAVPTTAGSGSEVSDWTVITSHNRKVSIGGTSLMPKAAILDPCLIATLPPAATAFAGMDALTHAIECFTNSVRHPVSAIFALDSIRRMYRALPLAVAQPENIDARADTLLASLFAGVAISYGYLGIAHSMAHPLETRLKVPHGLANAILLPEVMRFNLIGSQHQLAVLAEAMGTQTPLLSERDAADAAIKAVLRLNEDLGLYSHVRGLVNQSVTGSLCHEMASEAIRERATINARRPTLADLEDVYRKVLKDFVKD
jgi:alcohol dehydrogenase class IV